MLTLNQCLEGDINAYDVVTHPTMLTLNQCLEGDINAYDDYYVI